MRVCRSHPKPNQSSNGLFQKKIQAGEVEWGRTFFRKIPRLFKFVTLPLEILEETKLCPWKFCKLLLHPLEIPVPSKNQYPWKFHINFLSPLEIPLLFHLNPVISTCSIFIQYPSKFHVLNPPCCLDFFWNGPITELCVVVIQSEILLRCVYLARYFKTGISMSVQSEHIVIL